MNKSVYKASYQKPRLLRSLSEHQNGQSLHASQSLGSHEDDEEDASSHIKPERQQSLPCDYISEFNSLRLNEVKPITRTLSAKDSETKSTYFDSDSDSESFKSFDTLSMYSGTVTCNNTVYSSNDSTSYESSVFRPRKRRCRSAVSSVSSFDSQNINDLVYKPLVNGVSSNCVELKGKLSARTICQILTILLSIVLFLLLLTTFLLIIISFCETSNSQSFDLNSVEENLSQCLIGHEFTVSAIKDALNEFNLNKIENKVHFMWWVGPVGTGKSYAKQLIRNSIGPTVNVFNILGTLLSKQNFASEKEVQSLIENIDICKPNLIFIDEFDENSDVISKYLFVFFERLEIVKKVAFHPIKIRLCIIVLGIWGSDHILQSYAEHNLYEVRNTFDYKNLQLEMYNFSPFANINFSLHSTIVPFLPLEYVHVEKCVIQTLHSILRNESCIAEPTTELEIVLKSKSLTIEDVKKNVFGLLAFHKEELDEIAALGCKRVYHFVSSLLSEDL